jgi:hypothetical protein
MRTFTKYLVIFLFPVAFTQPLDDRYHTYDEIISLVDSLSNIESYQDWFMVDTIGYSSQDNIPIIAVKVSDNVHSKEDEPRALFIGQVHAEEVLGVEIVLDLMMDLLDPRPEDFNHMNILKSYFEIWIIPSANPEGLSVVHEELDLTYRKNKSDFSAEGPVPNGVFDYEPSIGNDIDGVDLNRNFSFNWTFGDTFLVFDESDYGSHYDYYRGPQPFSEKEAIAIRDLALENDFVFSVVWHSSRSGRLSEKVFTSWQWEDNKPSPDSEVMKGIADTFSELLETEDGTGNYLSLFSGSRNGKLHDWFYRETGCIQYLIECGTSNMQPDSILIENTIYRTKPAMVYLLDRAIGYNTDAGQATGIIFDQSSGLPIEGAHVEIDEHSGSVLKPRLTNEFGRYRRILNAGTYHLNVSKKGYLSQNNIIVANNSGITTNDFYLESAPLYSLQLGLDYSVMPDTVECILISDFDSDSLVLSSSNNSIELNEGNWTIIVNSQGGTPWEKTIYLDRDTSFTIPVDPSISYLLSHDWDWNSQDGSWFIDNGILHSQESLYYDNNDSLLGLQWIETEYYDLTGSNRIIFSIDHRYETEWDHDSVGISILDTNNMVLHKAGWSGDKWGRFQNDYTTAISQTGFGLVKVMLWFKTDLTVNYRGWEINQLRMHAVSDNYLTIGNASSNSHPQITFGVQNIFPNPSYGKFQLEISSWQGGPAKVKVYNILGQQIMSRSIDIRKKGDLFLDLDFTELTKGLVSSGMIFVAVEANNQKFVRKCIILKN